MIRKPPPPTRVASRHLLPALLAVLLPVCGNMTEAWAAKSANDAAKTEKAAKPATVEKKPNPEKPAKSAPKQKPVAQSKRDLMKIPNSQIDLIQWSDIQGWAADDHAEAFSAYLASCRAILRSPAAARAQRPVLGALFDICERAVAAIPLDDAGAKEFYEKNFRPARLAPLSGSEGFFTGYYEPIVEGARFPSDVYTTPLYRRPTDLLVRKLRHAKGKGKFSKRTVATRSGQYLDRIQIEDGALAGRGLEICWLKDPIDAFFAQIQGSVRVRLEDGSVIRLNYDAQNGHPYTAVGRFLVERGIYTREEISMQKIREWMVANPEEGAALRRLNKSYVFFRETDLSEHEDPPGAQGVALTAGRSIAVDRNIHTYGVPFFIDAELPIQSEKADTRFRRLMVAQDTGGAIIGPARADIYLGAGDEAARAAGRFKHFGRFVMLIPQKLDPAKDTDVPPLPLPRPKIEVSASAAATRLAARETPAMKPAALDPSIPLPKARPTSKKQ
jgi:membrane-bound lytic murein transglycosylase A